MKGFSLIELLVAMLIFVGLSLTAGLVSQGLYSRNELQTIKDEIKTALRYARAQALVRGETLYLTASGDDLDWSKGMALYDNQQHLPSQRVYQWQWHHPQWQITWQGFTSDNNIPFSVHPQHSAMNGRFILKNITDQTKVELVLNRLGLIRE